VAYNVPALPATPGHTRESVRNSLIVHRRGLSKERV
jgi:hypothetical protein